MSNSNASWQEWMQVTQQEWMQATQRFQGLYGVDTEEGDA